MARTSFPPNITRGSNVIGGGGGGAAGGLSSDAPIDETLHATYGDHFDAETLDAKWTRRNYVEANETKQAAPFGKSSLKLLLSRTGARQSLYQAAALTGDWHMTCTMGASYHKPMTGIFVVDSSGNGVGTSFYDNPYQQYVWNLTDWTYASGTQAVAGVPDGPLWLELKKVGTNYTGRHSMDGINWSAYTPAQAWAGTPAFIGFGNFLAPEAGTYTAWIERFNLVAD